MQRTMVKQPTPPPQNPPPAPTPDHSRPVNWNAPVTRGDFEQGIGALDKKLSRDINALDKRLTVVETKIEVLDEKIEEVKTDVKALRVEVKENSDTIRAEHRADIKGLRTSMEANHKFLIRLILGSGGVLAALMAVLKFFV